MSRKKKNTTGMPDYEIDSLARELLPAIQSLFETEEGKREFAIFNAIVQKKGLEPVVDAVQSVIGGIDTAKDTNSVEDVSKEKNNLQSSANYSSGTAQDAAANLQAMVEKIKKR